MKNYLDGANTIMRKGYRQEPAREGMVATKSYTSLQLRFDLGKGKIPILTTKHISIKNVVAELLWMLRGQNNIIPLAKDKCYIWHDNAYKWFCKINEEEHLGFPELTFESFKAIIQESADTNEAVPIRLRKGHDAYLLGDNGRIYGWQWRNRQVDQIADCIAKLTSNPTSRQNKVVAWIPEDMNYKVVSQPNCHGDFTINTKQLDGAARIVLLKEKLRRENVTFNINEVNDRLNEYGIPRYSFTLSINQRSGDYALGVPYNITSYAILANIIGLLSNTVPKLLVMTITDAHIYMDHIKTLKEQCRLEPLELPELRIKGRTFKDTILADDRPTNLDEYLDSLNVEDFTLTNYKNHGVKKFKLHTGTITNKTV